MLELHELKLARNEIEAGEVGFPDHGRQGEGIVVSDRAVKALSGPTSNSGATQERSQ